MLAQDKQNLRDTCPSKLEFQFFSSPEYSFTLVAYLSSSLCSSSLHVCYLKDNFATKGNQVWLGSG